MVNCQEHSGTATAAREQAGMQDIILIPSPSRYWCHTFIPGQVPSGIVLASLQAALQRFYIQDVLQHILFPSACT